MTHVARLAHQSVTRAASSPIPRAPPLLRSRVPRRRDSRPPRDAGLRTSPPRLPVLFTLYRARRLKLVGRSRLPLLRPSAMRRPPPVSRAPRVSPIRTEHRVIAQPVHALVVVFLPRPPPLCFSRTALLTTIGSGPQTSHRQTSSLPRPAQPSSQLPEPAQPPLTRLRVHWPCAPVPACTPERQHRSTALFCPPIAAYKKSTCATYPASSPTTLI
jgi:hypothetical protein